MTLLRFNQLQRGASAGADLNDFRLIGVVSGRLSEHLNVSANLDTSSTAIRKMKR